MMDDDVESATKFQWLWTHSVLAAFPGLLMTFLPIGYRMLAVKPQSHT